MNIIHTGAPGDRVPLTPYVTHATSTAYVSPWPKTAREIAGANPPSPPIPPLIPGTLIYECRGCKVQFPAYHVEDSVGMLKAIITAYRQLASVVAGQPGPSTLPLAIDHECGGGRIGVADVVVVKKDA